MRLRRYSTLFPVLLLFALGMGTPADTQVLPSEPEVILMRADPEIIVADGQSSATITAEVRDRQGAIVADSTAVHFTTTAGMITPMMLTRGGVVRATLRSDATEGVAEITASAGSRAIARVRVTFTAEKIPLQQMKPFVRIDGQSIQYIPEKALVDTAGAVHISYRSFEVWADLAQVEANTLRLKARTNVRVKCAGKEISADLLALDLQTGQGTLVAIEESGHVRRQSFSVYNMLAADLAQSLPAGTYDFTECEDAKAIMTARKLTLFPGDKLQFSHFTLHVADAQVVSLPFYVLSLNPYGQDADQYLSLDSLGGLSVNLPFYYNMTDNSNGSLRLRRQSRYSYDGYSTRPGWQLAVQQRYNFGEKNHGVFEVNHITSSDWGARWVHEQQFGLNTHSYVSVDSPTHKDFYARTELYHTMPVGDLSLSAYGSMVPDVPSQMQSRLYFRMRPGVIKGPNIQYYWSANMGFSQWGNRSYLEPGMDLQIIPPSIALGKATSLQLNMGTGYSVSSSGTGPTAQASAGVVRRLGRASSASLRYSYYFSGRTSEFFGATTSQSITGQLFTGGSKRWNSSLTATLLPDSKDLSVYGSLVYSPFRNWRFELRPTYSSFGGAGLSGGRSASTNLDIYLARQIGGRDLALRWSTLDKRVRFELGTTALRF